MGGDTEQRRKYPLALVFAVLFSSLLVLHIPLLRLQYFWDEAGYYIPAARDLFIHGTLIPYSTPSNAHPPLVLAYLALAWKIFGYAPWVTRTGSQSPPLCSPKRITFSAWRICNCRGLPSGPTRL